MKTLTPRKTGTLVCGALLATIVAVEEPANADLILGQSPIIVSGSWVLPTGGVYTNVGPGTHIFGGAPTVLPGTLYPQFTVGVTSGLSQRPGWQYEVVLDFSQFGVAGLGVGSWQTQLDIKPQPAANPITGYQVKNSLGEVINTVDLGSNGGTIHISNNWADFNFAGTPPLLIIQFNQAPAPGAFALLGVAGVISGSRRRRQN